MKNMAKWYESLNETTMVAVVASWFYSMVDFGTEENGYMPCPLNVPFKYDEDGDAVPCDPDLAYAVSQFLDAEKVRADIERQIAAEREEIAAVYEACNQPNLAYLVRNSAEISLKVYRHGARLIAYRHIANRAKAAV